MVSTETKKKTPQRNPGLYPGTSPASIQWALHLHQKWRHSFASPSLYFKSTFQNKFHFKVQCKSKLLDVIEFCPFPSHPSQQNAYIKPLQIITPLDAISHPMRSAASFTKCLFYIYLLHVDTSSWFQVAVHLKDNIIHQTFIKHGQLCKFLQKLFSKKRRIDCRDLPFIQTVI